MKKTADDLRKTVQDAYGWLSRVDENTSKKVPGSKWSLKEILGHLIDSAANNHQRFIRLQQGDLENFPGYEQDAWVSLSKYRDREWRELVELWHNYNLHLVHVVAYLDPGSLTHFWNEPKMTLAFLAEDYVAHMSHHLSAIRKAI